MKIEHPRKSYQDNIDEGPLYQLHHMHHFKKRSGIEHELHHCFLFEREKMQGQRFVITHKTLEDKILHCVQPNHDGFLFDHAGNKYKTQSFKAGGEILSRIVIDD